LGTNKKAALDGNRKIKPRKTILGRGGEASRKNKRERSGRVNALGRKRHGKLFSVFSMGRRETHT